MKTEQDRGEARCNQVLDAAADCFRQRGFHGASMSELAKAAGMSVGHIYHYFENKEAIIAAIVERDVAEILALLDSLHDEEDILQALIREAGNNLEEATCGSDDALQLEVLAEATRNPKVLAMVRDGDRLARNRLAETITKGRAMRGLAPLADLEARSEIIIALFEGLTCRNVRNPGVPLDAIATVLRSTLQNLLET
ncbi:TetR/AcrR family transcriptional regulator [Jeongeupia naejangsanensis]|uniref:TetR/AcrR family transcriptional regulator n=1 Tax=Jeongeupia naejangsanensis TaxID=613195 RepID=A0ABS2BQJ5_9NEIS|nr:TetR/AcrR family transcriptional regulator [Jeongeupia naejangsanensis]MBM3117915.1 TetR/AcrR family transcriptional regulator [Jeongeupia naejangsanensis]